MITASRYRKQQKRDHDGSNGNPTMRWRRPSIMVAAFAAGALARPPPAGDIFT
jgi:hypothetical protein